MTEVIASDIDGTLTSEGVMDLYQQASDNSNIVAGIITRRPPRLRDNFIKENDIDADFQRSAVLKSFVMEQIENRYDADSYTYVGNRITDNFHSRISGWEFIQIPDQKEQLMQMLRR